VWLSSGRAPYSILPAPTIWVWLLDGKGSSCPHTDRHDAVHREFRAACQRRIIPPPPCRTAIAGSRKDREVVLCQGRSRCRMRVTIAIASRTPCLILQQAESAARAAVGGL
jgi:hypothetical protein